MDGQNWSMHGEDGNFQTTEASLIAVEPVSGDLMDHVRKGVIRLFTKQLDEQMRMDKNTLINARIMVFMIQACDENEPHLDANWKSYWPVCIGRISIMYLLVLSATTTVVCARRYTRPRYFKLTESIIIAC
ncbi:hypothetical protein ABG067_000795 [Albugo candida]